MMSAHRDYNEESKDTEKSQYGYSFDYDVMHPYMIRSFQPFLQRGGCLELGSYEGSFTEKLQPYFDNMTCVDASDEAIEVAKNKISGTVSFIHSRFEDLELKNTYNNVILTHVLEHVDNPVELLKKVNLEWLSENGRFFIVCPNANAPSRQIAVKMGLISHNSAVTPSESAHGHRITYSLDTLERDIKLAGLKIVHRSGVFFKALANFQWDQLLQTDIISKEYLDGCYELGQQYPDLCSSILFVCEKGVN